MAIDQSSQYSGRQNRQKRSATPAVLLGNFFATNGEE